MTCRRCPAGLSLQWLHALILIFTLTSCVGPQAEASAVHGADSDFHAVLNYAPVDDAGNRVAGVQKMDPRHLRQIVTYSTKYPPGTIVVDPAQRFLYLVMLDGKAMRYAVGVARAGLEFSGETRVAYKKAWPRWTPTLDMIKRNPEHYGPIAKGVPGGVDNPLGARALYLFRGGKDTLYRIHGTNEPRSIGQSVSSGCIRLLNQDIIDLSARVAVGARVVVLSQQKQQKGEY
jgi:lipoprotein-anchoring transpeptidase ErfK/SrfK